MPIYEYVCEACGHAFEHFARSMSEKGPGKCPKCHAGKLNKSISVIASTSNLGRADDAPAMGGCGRCGDPYGPCS